VKLKSIAYPACRTYTYRNIMGLMNIARSCTSFRRAQIIMEGKKTLARHFIREGRFPSGSLDSRVCLSWAAAEQL